MAASRSTSKSSGSSSDSITPSKKDIQQAEKEYLNVLSSIEEIVKEIDKVKDTRREPGRVATFMRKSNFKLSFYKILAEHRRDRIKHLSELFNREKDKDKATDLAAELADFIKRSTEARLNGKK